MATQNKNLATPARGSNQNQWDVPLNSNFVYIDSIVAATYAAAFTSSNITLSATDALNLRYACTGTLGANCVLIFPASVGGFWIVSNACSGAFTLSVRSGAGAAIVIPQGGSAFVTSDGTTMKFADGLGADGQLVYALDTGAADAYVTTTPFPVTLTAGAMVRMKAANTNTGASTLNASGTGATAIRDSAGTALTAGMITSGVIYDLIYNGTVWVMAAAVIPNGSVALAKLSTAGAAQGAVPYLGASAWTSLAAGTTGQVLASGGAAANPSWTTAQRPLLVTLTASASAALVFTSAQGFSNTLFCGYSCVVQNLAMTDDSTDFLFRVSTDNGATYLTTGTYEYIRQVANYNGASPATAAAGAVGATSVAVLAAVGNAAGEHISGTFDVLVGGAVASGTKIIGSGGYKTASGDQILASINGYNTTATQINAFEFLPSAATFASGTIRIYGIPK